MRTQFICLAFVIVLLCPFGSAQWVQTNGPCGVHVHTFAVSGTNLFAGIGENGVWRRPLAEMTTDVESAELLPKSFVLEQNYPNPFNPSTTIRYALPHKSSVSLMVHNTLGQQVAQLVNSEIKAGVHEVKFEAAALPSGVYFYRLQARPTEAGQAGSPSMDSGPRAMSSGYVDTKKLLVVR